ncbi:ETC complex I subunit [Celeribacter sp.]|uniref:ETC complex I subunit n=1 Tax=Celeribacter sp. TaxID=1890673 RepID=UPI003A8FB003
MRARIYQPARNAMQSGQAKTKEWILDFAPAAARDIDPLMGWTSSTDTQTQVRMKFDSKDAAIAYASEKGIDYIVQEPHKRAHNVRPGGYGDNFATNRKQVWTH